jgi:hypothetical protein
MPVEVDRRKFFGGAAAIAAVGAASAEGAHAADTSKTLAIASPAAPQGLDSEYDVSLGTVDSVGAPESFTSRNSSTCQGNRYSNTSTGVCGQLPLIPPTPSLPSAKLRPPQPTGVRS